MILGAERYDHREFYSTSKAFVATSLTFFFQPVPEGVIHYVERFISHVSGNHTATGRIYVSTGEAADALEVGRVDFTATVVEAARDYANPICIQPGYRLVATFAPGTIVANDVISITVQRAVCLTNPGSQYGSLSGPERLALSHQEEIEAEERKHATVVGGSGWDLSQHEGPSNPALMPWTSAEQSLSPFRGMVLPRPPEDES